MATIYVSKGKYAGHYFKSYFREIKVYVSTIYFHHYYGPKRENLLLV
jgi:hypothetical protein